jgi:hypothetical protein
VDPLFERVRCTRIQSLFQFFDFDVPIVDFPAFRLKADVSLGRLSVMALVDEFAV